MQAERFKRMQALFQAALEQPAEMRVEFVHRTCDDDREMAEEILELLGYEAQVASSETVRPLALAATAMEEAERRSLIGSAIGRYRVEAEIASGGMGRVFKARRIDGDIEQIVALKLMRVEMFNPALLKRFSSERKILASLNHPGIAHIIDAGTDERGTPFVAMEYVDGLPLHDYCARNDLSIRARIELFRQVLAAVAHAHRSLVVHRDLKPDNVLVTADGRVKLLDFGIAKELDLGTQATATAHRFFTPAFAAPEQLGDDSVSVSCDVYGLGAVLYTVLTGEPPFDFSALTQGEIERRIRMVPPLPMSATVSARDETSMCALGIENKARWIKELKGDLEQIVQKALRKEPQSRYVSVEQFDEDIARYLDRRPVLASGAGWWYRARKFCERNALATSFTLTFAISGVIGVTHVLQQNAEIRQQNTEIRVQRDRAESALDILQITFRGADPEGLDGGDISARSLFAKAAREVDRKEVSEPMLFHDLAYRIADIQLNMGMTGAALDLIQRANRVDMSRSDENILLEIRARIMADDYAQARSLINASRARFSARQEFIAEDAHLLYLEKNYEKAIALLEPLLAQDTAASTPALRDRIYRYLAEAYRESDRFERAMAILDRQINEQTERYGEDHPSILITRLRRVEPLIQLKQAAEAERELLRIKQMLVRHYDQDSSVLALYHNLAGSAANVQEKSEVALANYRQALAINQKVLGEDHENTLRSHLNIAQVIRFSGGDRTESYLHFSEAIAGFEKNMKATGSLAGFARLEAATGHYWDGNKAAGRRILTPPHALDYFERMTTLNRGRYLAALFYGFGRQDCGPAWQTQAQGQPQSERMARTLMCRYDPKAKHVPVD
jgi:serine/threonine protein kinase